MTVSGEMEKTPVFGCTEAGIGMIRSMRIIWSRVAGPLPARPGPGAIPNLSARAFEALSVGPKAMRTVGKVIHHRGSRLAGCDEISVPEFDVPGRRSAAREFAAEKLARRLRMIRPRHPSAAPRLHQHP